MIKFYVVCLSVLFSFACHAKPTQLTRYVNPFIGTIIEGHVYPGATLPFGMVQLSPDNGLTKEDKYEGYCAGYSYTKNMVKGFIHTHLSGTGRPDLGDISILPMVSLEPNVSDIRSEISHHEESTSPGYYMVMLKTFGIKAELTATQRCGFHRYTFPGNLKSMIRFDLAYGAGDDATVDSEFKQIDATTFVGYRISKSSFTKDQRIYFAARISKPIAKMVLYRDSLIVNGGKEAKGKDITACLLFTTVKNEQVMVKVGLSTADVEGALAGLKETGDWNFDAIKKKAEDIW